MLINSLKFKIGTLFYLIFFLTSTWAQGFLLEPDEDHPFGLVFDDDEALVFENQTAHTTFHLIVPENYYIYKDLISVTPNDPEIQVQLSLPEAEMKDDPFLEKTTEVYHHDVKIDVTFTLKPDARIEKLSGEFAYQGCSDKICFRMMRQKFNFEMLKFNTPSENSQSAHLTVPVQFLNNDSPSDAKAVTEKSEEKAWWEKINFEMDSNANDSFWYALISKSLIALLLGVLSSFSVCVLPLIPLTISFIGAKNESWRKTTITLLFFVLGMISMNAPLGMMAAWLGVKFGFQYQNPWFLFGVTTIFFAMGLWMLGVFQWQLPVRLQTAVSKVQSQGLLRAYFSGLTIGVMAFACIGPFILPLLAFVSSSKNIFTGFFVMSFYSLGMSGLFVVASFFSTGWMKRFGEKSYGIKRLSGLVMILAGLYFGWVFMNAHVFPNFMGQKKHDQSFFQTDYQRAVVLAQNENKKIIIDFYADWCLPCQEWERHVWSKADVQKSVLEAFVPLKVDCTTDSQMCTELTDRFHIQGMPTLVFTDQTGQEIKEHRLVGSVLSAEDFIKFIKQIQ